MNPTSADIALSRILDSGMARARGIGAEHTLLWSALTEATQGGKRFRPALLLAVHAALGGSRAGAAAEVGAAIELLHTAFVVHDDVIDDDHVRRGRLNVSGTFAQHAMRRGATDRQAADYGRTAAILAGDLAIAASMRAVATCPAPRDIVDRLLDLMDGALHVTSAGELNDVRLSLDLEPAELGESLQMEEYKTAIYSFSLPLTAAAVLADSQSEVVDALDAAGRSLGIAFQLTDDLIGIFGDPDLSGKSCSSDLQSCKQTPMLIHARSTPQWPAINGFLGRPLDGQDLHDVRELLTTCGSRGFTESLARQQLQRALTTLAALDIPTEPLESLIVRTDEFTRQEAAA